MLIYLSTSKVKKSTVFFLYFLISIRFDASQFQFAIRFVHMKLIFAVISLTGNISLCVFRLFIFLLCWLSLKIEIDCTIVICNKFGSTLAGWKEKKKKNRNKCWRTCALNVIILWFSFGSFRFISCLSTMGNNSSVNRI